MNEKLFGTPARVKIITTIAMKEGVNFSELKKETGLTDGNLSSHIARLEEAGIVEVKKAFVGKRPKTRYFLTREGKKKFLAYLNEMEKIIETLKQRRIQND